VNGRLRSYSAHSADVGWLCQPDRSRNLTFSCGSASGGINDRALRFRRIRRKSRTTRAQMFIPQEVIWLYVCGKGMGLMGYGSARRQLNVARRAVQHEGEHAGHDNCGEIDRGYGGRQSFVRLTAIGLRKVFEAFRSVRRARIRPLYSSAIAAVVIVAVASGRIASTYKVLNLTIDEPAHIACGIQWLDAGFYRYEVQHPPLARVVAALGARYAGGKYDGDPNMWLEGFRLLGGGVSEERGLVFGRIAMLPFFWAACAVVFLWARRLGGPAAAVISLMLFSSLPPILGHAGLITTDMALTATTGAAFLAALK
jgi:hypothetical protein